MTLCDCNQRCRSVGRSAAGPVSINSAAMAVRIKTVERNKKKKKSGGGVGVTRRKAQTLNKCTQHANATTTERQCCRRLIPHSPSIPPPPFSRRFLTISGIYRPDRVLHLERTVSDYARHYWLRKTRVIGL